MEWDFSELQSQCFLSQEGLKASFQTIHNKASIPFSMSRGGSKPTDDHISFLADGGAPTDAVHIMQGS